MRARLCLCALLQWLRLFIFGGVTGVNSSVVVAVVEALVLVVVLLLCVPELQQQRHRV